jgi:hypothetical protein
MRVVFQGDFGIAVTHHPRNDVDWSAGLEQLGGYPVSKAVNPNVSSFHCLDPELNPWLDGCRTSRRCLRETAGPSS